MDTSLTFFAINFMALIDIAVVSIARWIYTAVIRVDQIYYRKPELVVEVCDVVCVRGVGRVGDGGDLGVILRLRLEMDAAP